MYDVFCLPSLPFHHHQQAAVTHVDVLVNILEVDYVLVHARSPVKVNLTPGLWNITEDLRVKMQKEGGTMQLANEPKCKRKGACSNKRP